MQLTSVDGNARTSGGLVLHFVEKLRIAERGLEVKFTGGGARPQQIGTSLVNAIREQIKDRGAESPLELRLPQPPPVPPRVITGNNHTPLGPGAENVPP